MRKALVCWPMASLLKTLQSIHFTICHSATRLGWAGHAMEPTDEWRFILHSTMNVTSAMLLFTAMAFQFDRRRSIFQQMELNLTAKSCRSSQKSWPDNDSKNTSQSLSRSINVRNLFGWHLSSRRSGCIWVKSALEVIRMMEFPCCMTFRWTTTTVFTTYWSPSFLFCSFCWLLLYVWWLVYVVEETVPSRRSHLSAR